MICQPCKMGADIKGDQPLQITTKKNWHAKCKGGTHCSCQHRVGRKNT